MALMIIMLMAACGAKNDTDHEASADESVAATEKAEYIPPDYAISQEEGKINWAFKNGVMVYSNDEGLWRLSEDGEPQQIVKGDVTGFATDGQKILYGEKVSPSTADESDSTISRISVIHTDGTQNEVLVKSDEETLRPITMDRDVLYYLADTKKSKGKMIAWNTASSKSDKKWSSVDDVLLISGSKFYFTDKNMSEYELYCYHTDYDDEYHVGNDDFKWSEEQNVFCENDTYYAVGTSYSGGKTDITVYKLMPDDTTEVAKEVKGINGNVKKKNCVISGSALYYSISSGNKDTVYKLALDGDEPEEMTDTDRTGTLRLAGDSVIFQTDDVIFYCDGSELKAIDGLKTDLIVQQVLWCDNNTIYYSDNTKVGAVKKELNDDVPSAEKDTGSSNSSFDSDRPASQETRYVTTDQQMTRKFSGKVYITGENAETPYEATSRLPKVQLDSSDAQTVNEEIQTDFGRIFEEGEKDYAVRVDYVTYLNDNTLSLAVESVIERDHTIKVYNFDVTTGKQLTDDDFFALSDTSLEKARQMIVDAAPAQYNSMYPSMKMIQSDLDRTEEGLSYAKYYFDSNKQVIARYALYGTPGAGQSVVLMPLDAHYTG